jgi:hypothetical protein
MFTKKTLFLFLGLFLPILVFLFLKFFGKNQFDVPLIYGAGVPEIPTDCHLKYEVPYLLPDTVWNKINRGSQGLVLLHYGSPNQHVREVAGSFSSSEVSLLNGDEIEPNPQISDYIKRCYLLLKDPANLVLIDRQRNIRGYYNSEDRDDMDRLKTELTIILKKF